MRLRFAAVLAGLASLLLSASTASADCGNHWEPYLSPASGMPLPADPHLLLLGSAMPSDLSARVDGRPAPTSAERLGDEAWLVHVVSGGGRALTVTVGDRQYRYPIDRGWRRATTRIAGTARLEHEWTCSFTDAIGVAVETNAIGFRAEWVGDETRSTWLPTFYQLSWHAEAAQHRVLVDGPRGPEVVASPRFALVEMGHHSCQGWNVPPALYQDGGAVSLTAIHADGSRESLGRIALTSDVTVPALGALIDITPLGEREAEPPPGERDRHDPHRLLLLALAAALAALLLRRRDRPTLAG